MCRIFSWKLVTFAVWFSCCPMLSEGQAARQSAAGNTKVNLYVSPAGADSWSGRIPTPDVLGGDGPFRTLVAARDVIRTLRQSGQVPTGGFTVHMRAGVYPLKETFELTAIDGGTTSGAVVYQAFEAEQVRLIGGRQVSGFSALSETAGAARVQKQYRDKIFYTSLRAQGITEFGQLAHRGFGRSMYPAALELFFQDKPMQLARWPNSGWVKIASVPAGNQGGRFVYENDRPGRWGSADDIWLHGYWTQDWADSYEKVKAIDVQTREISTYEPHGVYGYTAGHRYYVLNLLEELDAPGEWYLDRTDGTLYSWPPEPLSEGDVFVSLLEEPMVSLRDVSHVKLQRIIFECSRGTAVEVIGGSDNVIAGCTLRNMGNIAVDIKGGTQNGVVDCHIYETGDGGIRLSGGDRKTLAPAGNYACNNDIHHYSRWVRTYRPAISLSGVGHRIAHNLIHDGPHTGVLFGGNDHVLEFNEVYNVCYETGDVGAFYTGRDWTTRGHIIRYNYFHDITGPYTHGAMAVYLDDAASGATIYGNVFRNASRAVFIGGGRDNIVRNNIFVGCEPAVHVDARGLGWARAHIARSGGWRMYEKLRDVNFDQPPYSLRYPELAMILDGDPAVPQGNVIERNICFGGRWLDLQGVDKSIVTLKDNLAE